MICWQEVQAMGNHYGLCIHENNSPVKGHLGPISYLNEQETIERMVMGGLYRDYCRMKICIATRNDINTCATPFVKRHKWETIQSKNWNQRPHYGHYNGLWICFKVVYELSLIVYRRRTHRDRFVEQHHVDHFKLAGHFFPEEFMTWKRFLYLQLLVRQIHRYQLDSPQKGSARFVCCLYC